MTELPWQRRCWWCRIQLVWWRGCGRRTSDVYSSQLRHPGRTWTRCPWTFLPRRKVSTPERPRMTPRWWWTAVTRPLPERLHPHCVVMRSWLSGPALHTHTWVVFYIRPSSGFSARQHICRARCMLSLLRLSVCLFVRLFVTQVDQSKTTEGRMVQLSTMIHPSSLCGISFIQKFWRVPPERGTKQGWGGENKLFSGITCRHLEKGMRYVQSYY